MSAHDYLLDNQAGHAHGRFGALSALFDPATFRHVDALGIGPGRQCWEVGAGGPSVPDGLASRVGSSGRVLATDLDTRWLAGRTGPHVEVARHDVVADDPPEGGFPWCTPGGCCSTCRHGRRRCAGRSERGAPVAGCWLLVDDYDVGLQPVICPDAVTPDHRLANTVKAAFRQLLLDRGADTELGRRLPRLLREGGLTHVQADAYFPLAMPAVTVLEAANAQQVR